MTIFGPKLSEVEFVLLDNMRKPRSVFPEETQMIEFGLALMSNVTKALREYKI